MGGFISVAGRGCFAKDVLNTGAIRHGVSPGSEVAAQGSPEEFIVLHY